MPKLSQEQRTLIEQGIDVKLPSPTIAEQVTRQTGKATSSQQVNGYRNVYLGYANGRHPKVAAGQPPPAPGQKPPAAGAPPPPANPAEAGWTAPAGKQTADPFFSGPTVIRTYYAIYRKDPAHGYIGRIEGVTDAPFNEEDFSKLVGDGLYDVHRYSNDRWSGSKTDLRITKGIPPKFLDGRVAAPTQGNRAWLENPYQQQGAGGWPPPADPTNQFRNIFDVAKGMCQTMIPAQDPAAGHNMAVSESLKFASAVINQREAGAGAGGGMSQFFQTFLAENAADRRATVAARVEERKDAEARHARDMDRMRDEAKLREDAAQKDFDRRRQIDKDEEDRRRERDKEFWGQIHKIDEKRAEQVTELKASIDGQATAMQAELDQKVEVARQHYDDLYTIRREGIDREKVLTDEIHTIRKLNLETKSSEGALAHAVEKGIDRLGSTIDRIGTLKAVKELPPEERQTVLKLLNNSNGNGNGNGNGHNGNGHNGNGHADNNPAGGDVANDAGPGDFRKDAVDKVLGSPFFTTLQDEWATYIEAGAEFGPEPFVAMFVQWTQKSPNMMVFAGFMIPRGWEKIFDIMKPKLSAKNLKVFESPGAKPFYETFRRLLYANIKVLANYAAKKVAEEQPAT